MTLINKGDWSEWGLESLKRGRERERERERERDRQTERETDRQTERKVRKRDWLKIFLIIDDFRVGTALKPSQTTLQPPAILH